MKKILKISLVASLALSSAYASEVSTIQEMFANGKISGQIRLGYINNTAATAGANDTSATAIGGQLKFETASFNGVSFGTAMYTSQSIDALSGDSQDGEYNEDLASSEKAYTELAEAYINYAYNGLNIRAGRQLIDTPLADSDDIRMTPHTFEAYVASYEFKDLGLTFIGANVRNWQGVDAGYGNVTNNRWDKTGEDGTWMAAALYANDIIEVGAWYYDVTKSATAVYVDATGNIDLGNDIGLTLAAQYLTESETDNSTIDGSIAGVMAEVSISSLTVGLAYDAVSVDNGKQIFEGFGGGSSFTNMDTMTAGTLHDGTYGDGSSFVASLAYEVAGATLIGAYGSFEADAIGAGASADVSEINLGIEYAYNDGEIDLAVYYIIGEDKESSADTSFDDDHIQITLNYNF